MDLLKLIQLNNVNHKMFSGVMAALFHYNMFSFHFNLTPFIFYQLLDINMIQLNTNIKHNLREYIESISIDEWNVLVNELRFIVNHSTSIAYDANVPSMRQLIGTIHERNACLLKYVHRTFFTWQHIHNIKEVLNHYIRLIVRGYSKSMSTLNELEIINICCAFLESTDIIDICGRIHGPVTKNIVHNVLYPVVEFHKLHIYENYLQDKYKNFPTFQYIARQWVIGESWVCTKKTNVGLCRERFNPIVAR
eukprot:347848_1